MGTVVTPRVVIVPRVSVVPKVTPHVATPHVTAPHPVETAPHINKAAPIVKQNFDAIPHNNLTNWLPLWIIMNNQNNQEVVPGPVLPTPTAETNQMSLTPTKADQDSFHNETTYAIIGCLNIIILLVIFMHVFSTMNSYTQSTKFVVSLVAITTTILVWGVFIL